MPAASDRTGDFVCGAGTDCKLTGDGETVGEDGAATASSEAAAAFDGGLQSLGERLERQSSFVVSVLVVGTVYSYYFPSKSRGGGGCWPGFASSL